MAKKLSTIIKEHYKPKEIGVNFFISAAIWPLTLDPLVQSLQEMS